MWQEAKLSDNSLSMTSMHNVVYPFLMIYVETKLNTEEIQLLYNSVCSGCNLVSEINAKILVVYQRAIITMLN